MDSNNASVVDDVIRTEPAVEQEVVGISDADASAETLDTELYRVVRSPWHLLMTVCLALLTVAQAFNVVMLAISAVASVRGVDAGLPFKMSALSSNYWFGALLFAVINAALLAFLVIALIHAYKVYCSKEVIHPLYVNRMGKGAGILKLFAYFNCIDVILYAFAALLLCFDRAIQIPLLNDGYSFGERMVQIFNFAGFSNISFPNPGNTSQVVMGEQSRFNDLIHGLSLSVDANPAWNMLLSIGAFVILAAVALLIATTMSKLDKCYSVLTTRSENSRAVFDVKPPVYRLALLGVVQALLATLSVMVGYYVSAIICFVTAFYYMSNSFYFSRAYDILEKDKKKSYFGVIASFFGLASGVCGLVCNLRAASAFERADNLINLADRNYADALTYPVGNATHTALYNEYISNATDGYSARSGATLLAVIGVALIACAVVFGALAVFNYLRTSKEERSIGSKIVTVAAVVGVIVAIVAIVFLIKNIQSTESFVLGKYSDFLDIRANKGFSVAYE